VVDYYVEIETVQGKRPFFFAQAKATAATSPGGTLRISSTKNDVAGLLQIPALPTFWASGLPIAYELTGKNLKLLHDEVVRFWSRGWHKPTDSVFL
jgi:hypothetical protein